MKLQALLPLVFSTLFFITGCGGGDSSSASPSDKDSIKTNTFFDENKVVIGTSEEKYDSSSKLTEVKYFDVNHDLIRSQKLKYDNSSNLVERIFSDKDNDLIYTIKRQYDEHNNNIINQYLCQEYHQMFLTLK